MPRIWFAKMWRCLCHQLQTPSANGPKAPRQQVRFLDVVDPATGPTRRSSKSDKGGRSQLHLELPYYPAAKRNVRLIWFFPYTLPLRNRVEMYWLCAAVQLRHGWEVLRCSQEGK